MRSENSMLAAAGLVGAESRGRIGGLDDLRGLSILWVMWCHGTSLWTWMPSAFSGYGFHGVVLFFVISGFLITRILLDEHGTPRYFSHFYVNRLFRIWPLMLVALAFSALLWPKMAGMAVFNLLMVNNYAYAYGIEPMVRTDVMWSLAIEEQFYLLWPVVAYFFGRRGIAWAAAIIVFLGFGFDDGLLPGGKVIIFKTTHGNMQYIAMGALVAIGREGLRYLLAAWAAFFLVHLSSRGLVGGLTGFRWIWYGVSFALGLLVHFTVYRRPLVLWSPLAEVGKLCYGLYLIHFFISWAVLEFCGSGVLWQGSFYLASSLVMAILSFRYFEKPALGLRAHVNSSERLRVLLFATLGLTTLTCVVAMIPTLKSIH